LGVQQIESGVRGGLFVFYGPEQPLFDTTWIYLLAKKKGPTVTMQLEPKPTSRGKNTNGSNRPKVGCGPFATDDMLNGQPSLSGHCVHGWTCSCPAHSRLDKRHQMVGPPQKVLHRVQGSAQGRQSYGRRLPSSGLPRSAHPDFPRYKRLFEDATSYAARSCGRRQRFSSTVQPSRQRKSCAMRIRQNRLTYSFRMEREQSCRWRFRRRWQR